MKALVTGGAGFLPSHLVESLIEGGHDVVVLDNFSAGLRENLAGLNGHLRIVEADVADASAVLAASEGCDVLYHLASDASVPRSVEDPRRDLDANALGMLSVLEAARKRDASRVVLASTAAVYGRAEYLPMDEAHPTRPLSPYGATKLAAEHLGHAWDATYGVHTTTLRLFNSYGPRQRRYVLYDLYRKMVTNPFDVQALGTGEEIRDYVYVKDTVRCLVAAADHPGMRSGTFNVGSGHAVRVKDLARMLMDRLGLNGETRLRFTGRSWPGDTPALHADVRRLRDLGLAPTTPFAEGLDTTVAWFRAHVREDAPRRSPG